MAKEESPSVPEKAVSEPEAEKSKREADIDIEDFDLNMIDEYITFPSENDNAVKKMAARRKIEMYWEKKRLKDQLGELDDADLDF